MSGRYVKRCFSMPCAVSVFISKVVTFSLYVRGNVLFLPSIK